MKIKVRLSQARLFGRASESVTRSDRRERELEFESSFPPLTARPNRRRERPGLNVEKKRLTLVSDRCCDRRKKETKGQQCNWKLRHF